MKKSLCIFLKNCVQLVQKVCRDIISTFKICSNSVQYVQNLRKRNLNEVLNRFCTVHFQYAERDFELLNVLNAKNTWTKKKSTSIDLSVF